MDEEGPMFSVSEELAPSNSNKQSTIVSLDFNGLLNPPLRLQTDTTECGGQVWHGGTVLAEYLIQQDLESMEGKVMFVCSKITMSSPLLRQYAHLYNDS